VPVQRHQPGRVADHTRLAARPATNHLSGSSKLAIQVTNSSAQPGGLSSGLTNVYRNALHPCTDRRCSATVSGIHGVSPDAAPGPNGAKAAVPLASRSIKRRKSACWTLSAPLTTLRKPAHRRCGHI
jgi:hypothetical protein